MAKEKAKDLTSYNKPFPQRLRREMELQRITQTEIAAQIGKTRQAVGYYADGTSSPDWETLAKISRFLNVSTDYLLGLTDIKTNNIDHKTVCEMTGLSNSALRKILSFKENDDGELRFHRDCKIMGLNILLSTKGIDEFLLAIDNCLPQSTRTITNIGVLKKLEETLFPEISEEKLNSLDEDIRRYVLQVRLHQANIDRIMKEEEENFGSLAIFNIQNCAVKIAEELVEKSKLFAEEKMTPENVFNYLIRKFYNDHHVEGSGQDNG